MNPKTGKCIQLEPFSSFSFIDSSSNGQCRFMLQDSMNPNLQRQYMVASIQELGEWYEKFHPISLNLESTLTKTLFLNDQEWKLKLEKAESCITLFKQDCQEWESELQTSISRMMELQNEFHLISDKFLKSC